VPTTGRRRHVGGDRAWVTFVAGHVYRIPRPSCRVQLSNVGERVRIIAAC
jgi:hypothetical protein